MARFEGEVTGRRPRVSADRVKHASGPPTKNEITATPHGEPKAMRGKKPPPIRGPPMAVMAYSIREFCEIHRISMDTYFRMQRLGFGPKVMKVGSRTLISAESAAQWRRARETAA
jgi:hypothetical protein